MNNPKKTLKTVVFSLGLAAMMAPATLNAQINRGLLQNPYKSQDDSRRGALNQTRDNESYSFTNGNFGETDPNDAPLGSGIAILIGAGLGYVALKKKEDEQ
jgi:hypothetical protein